MKLSDIHIFNWHLHYGLDPDTGFNALYLWNHRKNHVVRKLLKGRHDRKRTDNR